jgi:hypothetical protein
LGDGPTAPPRAENNKLRLYAATAEAPPSAAIDWYDTSNREVVRTAYNAVWVPTIGFPLGYGGNPAAGVAGDTSAAFKNAVLTRLNFMRAMAGVTSLVGLDAVRNAKNQHAALMMYANQQLSHTPPTSWLRYTTEGAEAAGKSNLCVTAIADVGCIEAYMDDFGFNNNVVGHRRWILYPQTQKSGTGDVPDGLRVWNALWAVEDSTVWNPRPATRDEFVAWPPKGYVPYQLVYNRWSFHHVNANFSGATVSVTRDGVQVPVSVETRGVPGGAPESAIVFLLDNRQANGPSTPTKPVTDAVYSVTIAGVIVNGASRTFTYPVIVFDPAAASARPLDPGVPAVVSLNPRSGSGFTATFTATFSQSSNNHYLGYLLILPTPNIVNYTATGSCLIEYNKYSNGVRLIDNAGTGWFGPPSGEVIKPGAATLTNNQCSVNVANVIANVSGSTMSVTVPVTFFQSLGPVLGTFLQAQDDKAVWTGMTQFGNWVLPSVSQNRLGPAIVGVNASGTTGKQATYSVTASHTSGASALGMVHLLVSASIVGSPACQVVYFPASDTLNIINAEGTALMLPPNVKPGFAGGVFSNGRCAINLTGSSSSRTTNTVTITLAMSFSDNFLGQKNVYVNAFDEAGFLTHWVIGSTMLVQ